MSVAKRSDGRYIVKFKDIEGRWKQRSFRSEDDARQFDAERRYDESENQRLTLLEAVLVYVKNHKLSHSTNSAYQYLVCGYDRQSGVHRTGPAEILATKYADALTRRDLETVRENCRLDGVSIRTMNDYTGKLKAALNWCVDQDLLAENPWAKYRGVPGGKLKHLTGTLEDFAKVYPFLPEWMQWAARTAIALCLRPGVSELFSLKWTAFDWLSQSVSVYMPKVDDVKVVYPPAGYMQEALTRYKADSAKGYELVCRNRKNCSVCKTTYGKSWAAACKKAGVSMPMYALRHIAASQMLAGGADLAAVAAQLGHKNIATTAGFYLHALPAAQRRAAGALPDCTALVQSMVPRDV